MLEPVVPELDRLEPDLLLVESELVPDPVVLELDEPLVEEPDVFAPEPVALELLPLVVPEPEVLESEWDQVQAVRWAHRTGSSFEIGSGQWPHGSYYLLSRSVLSCRASARRHLQLAPT